MNSHGLQAPCQLSAYTTATPRLAAVRRSFLSAARRQQDSTEKRRLVDKVVFLRPGRDSIAATNVGQRDLDSFMDKWGPIDLKAPLKGGLVSQRVDDLPEGGEVEVVPEDEPPFKKQARHSSHIGLHGKEAVADL